MDYYFVGDVDSDWGDADNWSATSGGAGGAGVPGSGDTAIFDGYSPDCNNNTGGNISITKLDVQAGFSNTLDFKGNSFTTSGDCDIAGGTVDFGQGSHNVTVGGDMNISGGTVTMPVSVPTGGKLTVTGTLDISGGSFDILTCYFDVDILLVSGGTFTMGSRDCDISSTGAGEGFRQSGGTVTLTSGTLEVNSDFERTAGTLNHNNGKVFMNRVIAADRDLNLVGAALYDLEITYGAYGIDVDSDGIIEGKLTFNSGRDLAGAYVLYCRGDIETKEDSTNYGTRVTLYVDGTGDQEIKGSSAVADRILPISGLIIDKASGTLSFTNRIKFQGNSLEIEYIQGTLDWSGCTRFHVDGHHTTVRCTADFTIGSTVEFYIDTDAFVFYVADGNLIIEGTLTGATYDNLNSSGGGEVHIKGDAAFNSDITAYPSDGLFVVNGTGTQSVEGTGQVTRLKIDKASGTLTLGSLAIGGDASSYPHLEYVKGTVTCTGTLELGDGAYDNQRIKTGDMELNNVIINPSGSYNFTVDGKCIIKGNLTISSVNSFSQANTGYIDVHGDLESNDAAMSGDCPINMRGGENQSLKVDGTDLPNADLTINKTGGTVTLGEDFAPASWTGDVNVTQGTLDLAGYDLNIAARTLTITDKLKWKGSETITATLVIGAASTIEYYDAAVEVTIDDFATTFFNLILGAGKTHKVTAGVGNGITVNGNFGSAGTIVNRAILRSTVDGTQWELDLQGSSGMSDSVDVKDSDASAGNRVTALNSEDSGNNDNWFFGIGQGGFGLFRPNSFRYNRGICPKQLG